MKRYTLNGGRVIELDGRPICYLGLVQSNERIVEFAPADADAMARRIVQLLNADKRKDLRAWRPTRKVQS